MKTYLVGGAVRDRLLGREVSDRDWVVVGATPEVMLEQGYLRVGADFPVFLHPETREEYALARTERKSGHGYTGFAITASPDVTLEQDLARRDLTINAIAEDDQGCIVDPFDGRRDLARGVLRHITGAFAEDPLRVLRVARFAARLEFEVAPETNDLMRTIADSGELAALTAERVWSEILRALAEPRPRRFVEVLRACNALRRVLPELDRLFGVPQPARYHPEIDTGEHILLALDQCVALDAGPKVRFAVLVHDLGKGATPADLLPSHRGHEHRSVALIEDVCDRFRIPKDFRALAVMVARHHSKIHRALELKPRTILRLLQDTDALRRRERFAEILCACECDARGRAGLQTVPYTAAVHLRAALAAVDGVDAGAIAARGLGEQEFLDTLAQTRQDAIRRVLETQPHA